MVVSSSTIAACIVTFAVSLLLPVAVYVIYGCRHKGKGVWLAWLFGAAGFFVPQMVIRIPILNMLAAVPAVTAFSKDHFAGYCLILGVTAALFETAGRYIVAKMLSKRLTFERSLASGLGHGGIEAMMLVGITYINNFIYIALINSGQFDAVLAEVSAMPEAVAQLEQVRDTLITSSAGLFLLSGLERLLTMITHVGMSVLVCYAMYRGRTWSGLLACFGVHAALDTVVGLLSGSSLPEATMYGLIYGFLAVIAIASIFFVRWAYRHWPNQTEDVASVLPSPPEP